MKNPIKILFALALLVSGFASAQINPGASCGGATCAIGGTYPSLTGSPSMGTYGCLYSTPNPNWIAVGIQTAGDIHFLLTQTSSAGYGIDVDFAVYGPFTSVAAGCPIGPGTPQVDCSYSGSATEYVDIPNAQPGQVYIILITNFNGSAGTISIGPNPSQPSTGTINCAVNFGVTASMTPAKCNQANGTVSATVTGGYPPYTYSWTIPGNPTTPTVNNVPPGTYTVTVTSGPNPMNGATVNPTTATITVTNQNATFTAVSTPASCPGGANGTATANWTMQGGTTGITATYQWNDPAGQTTKIATGLLPGTYTVTTTLSNGCVGTATVVVGANAVTYGATSTLVSCPGGNDGTATATMTPVVGTLSYAWNDPAAQNTATAYSLSAGTYTCTITSSIGCVGTATVNVTEIPGMIATPQTPVPASCNSKNDGRLEVDVTQGTAPYTYSWDNSTSTNKYANDLYAGDHVVTITDFKGCVITYQGTVTEPAPLDLTNIVDMSQSPFICPESSTTLQATAAGGNGPTYNNAPNYIYSWTENGMPIGQPSTDATIVVDPANSGTEYCVTLSELCGSPTTDTCITLTFPPAIVPRFVTDKIEDCEPARFEFALDLENPNLESEIDSILLIFGDGQQVVLHDGIWDTAHIYQTHGTYITSAYITSIHGCLTYKDTVAQSPLTAIKLPVAEFTFSANPTTMFETTVVMQDKSTSDVTKWTWSSPSSVPAASSSQDPTFTYPEGYTGVYDVRLIVETDKGCIDTVDKKLTVISDILFYAPNAFTPDGDEFNQTWKFSVDGIDFYAFELAIYNRWGEIVWETHDATAEWDGTYHGKLAPKGTYSWRARVKAIESDLKQEFTGVITIL